MPYVNIQITNENVTLSQKKQLIEQSTRMLQDVLGKDPNSTFVVIQEIDTDDWGWKGKTITEVRGETKARP